MRKRFRALTTIEYALLFSIIASLNVLAFASLLFGFQLGTWLRWQGYLVSVIACVAAVVGALYGVRLAAEEAEIRPGSRHPHRTHQKRTRLRERR